MGKTSYKGLRVDYQPGQKVKVMLGHDWFDAEVVKANRKTVVVVTLFSKTKYRRVQIKEVLPEHGGIAEDAALGHPKTVLEPYTVSGTKTVKLPRIRVKPLESEPPTTPAPQETVSEDASAWVMSAADEAFSRPPTPGHIIVEEPETIEDASAPEPEYEGPGLGKDEAPLIDYRSGPASEIPMAAEQAEAMLDYEDTVDVEASEIAEAINKRRDEQGVTEELKKAGVKPKTAADVLAELEKLIG